MTPRQRQMFEAIREWPNPYPPTVRDLARLCGITTSTAHWHLIHLRERGLVTWDAGNTRTIRTVAE